MRFEHGRTDQLDGRSIGEACSDVQFTAKRLDVAAHRGEPATLATLESGYVLLSHLEPVGHLVLGKPEELAQLTQRQLFGGEFGSTSPDRLVFTGGQFVDRFGQSLHEVPPSFSRVRWSR